MQTPAQHIVTPGAASSIHVVKDRNLLIIGNNFLETFSLDLNQGLLVKTLDLQVKASAYVSKSNKVFIGTNEGLKVFSAENLSSTTTYFPNSDVEVVEVLEEKDKVIFSAERQIIQLDLSNYRISSLLEKIEQKVTAMTSDEEDEYLFVADKGKRLVKFCIKDSKVVGQVDLESVPTALSCSRSGQLLFVGFEDGSFAELATKDLSVIFCEKVHDAEITSVRVPFRGAIVTSSKDGKLNFPQSINLPIKASIEPISTCQIIGESSVAAVCGTEGIRIFSLPRFPKPRPFGSFEEADEIMNDLLESIDAIQEKEGPRLPLYHELLQTTLFRLTKTHGYKFFQGTMIDYKPIGPYSTFVSSSNQIQISNGNENPNQEKIRLLTNDYSLEKRSCPSDPKYCIAVLQDFKKKIEYEGLLPILSSSPLKDIKVSVLKSGNFVWKLETEVDLSKMNSEKIEEPATMKFKNGTLCCFILDGEIDTSGKHQIILTVDGESYEIGNILQDLTLIDTQRRYWVLNFFSEIILEKI